MTATAWPICTTHLALFPRKKSSFTCRLEFPESHPRRGVDVSIFSDKNRLGGWSLDPCIELLRQLGKQEPHVRAELAFTEEEPDGYFSKRVCTLTQDGPLAEVLTAFRVYQKNR
jgi:hypothetical protein